MTSAVGDIEYSTGAPRACANETACSAYGANSCTAREETGTEDPRTGLLRASAERETRKGKGSESTRHKKTKRERERESEREREEKGRTVLAQRLFFDNGPLDVRLRKKDARDAENKPNSRPDLSSRLVLWTHTHTRTHAHAHTHTHTHTHTCAREGSALVQFRSSALPRDELVVAE